MKKALALSFKEFGLNHLKLRRFDLPTLTPSSVHLKFIASPINPSDINQLNGVYPVKACEYESSNESFYIGGNEGVARVIDLGKDVKHLKIGDLVIPSTSGFGTWRTEAICPQQKVLQLNNTEGLDPLVAATISVNPCTAYRMIKDFVNLKRNDVLIQNAATSAVGQAVIQLAKEWGLQTINVIRDRPNRIEVEKKLYDLGASLVLTEDQLRREEIISIVKELGLPKLALNSVGGDSCTNIARLLDQNGYLITYGGMSRRPVTIPTALFIFKNITCKGFWMTEWYKDKANEKERGMMMNELFEMNKKGKFQPFWHESVDWKVEEGREEDLERKLLTAFEGSGKKIFMFA